LHAEVAHVHFCDYCRNDEETQHRGSVNLWRLYAYGLAQAGEADAGEPEGGAITVVAKVRSQLDGALDQAMRVRPTRVQLQPSPPGSRTSPVREAVKALANGSGPRAEEAALGLARRLGSVMDLRSKAGLFVIAVRRLSASDPKREVALWVFPRDTVFRFRSVEHQIEVIEDVFSQTSEQRKLAFFTGRGVASDFQEAVVLDLQARRSGRPVALFWLEQFLGAVPELTDEQGSHFLADIFLRASKAVSADADREQIQAAVMALRTRPAAVSSISGLSDEFLSGTAKEAFENAAQTVIHDEKTRGTDFRIDREAFAASVGYRFFLLGEGTSVIAPLDAIGPGKTVEVEGEAPEAPAPTRVLRVQDVIVDDKLRKGRPS
jgi:hypothetical protein